MKISYIKLLDEVNCAVLGLSPNHIMSLYEDYARFAPNYFFAPEFKLGKWDGKIRFFFKNGKTYIYLLDEIIPKLLAFGYKIEILDERIGKLINPPHIAADYFSHIIDPRTGEPIVLRYYQVDAVNFAIDYGNGMVIAGTGSGKTLMTAALADIYGKLGLKTVVIVPTQDLISQTKDQFKICELDVGEYSGDEKDYNHTHVISTWQTLQNNPTIIQEFNVVIVDECLAENTQITMANGTTKNIKDICVGDSILTYNLNTKLYEKNKVIKQHINLTNSISEQMYTLEFDIGIVLEVTGNHKLLTTKGYVRADELTEEDEIINIFDGNT